MKNEMTNGSVVLEKQYCKKCKQYTNHRISKSNKKNIKKLDCLYCESKKNKKKYGVAKSKPKRGWTKINFTV